jgi:hypothetical protein
MEKVVTIFLLFSIYGKFYVFLTITMEIFFKKMSSRERNKFVDLLGLVHKIFGWFLVFWGTVVSNRDVKCFR